MARHRATRRSPATDKPEAGSLDHTAKNRCYCCSKAAGASSRSESLAAVLLPAGIAPYRTLAAIPARASSVPLPPGQAED